MAAHRLVAVVEMDAFEGSLFIDNRGTAEAGEIQSYLRGAANSVLWTGDQLSAGVFTIPGEPQELIFGEMSYAVPFNRWGTTMVLYGAVSRVDAGASLADFDTEIQSRRMSVKLVHPFLRKKNVLLRGEVGFQARRIEEEELGAMVFEDRLRILHGGLLYRHKIWNGNTSAYVEVSQGLKLFDGSVRGTGPLSRPDADGTFTKFEARLSRYQNIGRLFGLYLAGRGQLSDDALLSSEEFGVGGAQIGRAFDYSEITGDDGVSGLAELRFGANPPVPQVDFAQLFGFYDVGSVWNENTTPERRQDTLSSAGVGFRITFPKSVRVKYEAARPLTRVPFTQDDKDWRHFFSVSAAF